MNFPKIYRRFAVAAVGILIVGLFPASALAGTGETFTFEFSVSSLATTTSVAGQPLDVTVTASNDGGETTDVEYAGTVTLTSTNDTHAVLLGPCDFSASTATPGICTVPDGVTFKTAGKKNVTATDADENTSTSPDVTVTPAAASTFVVSAPAEATVGVAAAVLGRRHGHRRRRVR